MKYVCIALAGAVLAGEASAFTPAAMPALQRRGSTSVCMAAGPPYLDSLGSVAAAPAAAKVSVPFDPKELLRVPWSAGSESKPAAAKTQPPPPAKLPWPKAKLEAKAVNEKQWLNLPAAASTPAAPAPGATAKPAEPFDPKALLRVPWTPGSESKAAASAAAKPAPAPAAASAPAAAGTQPPPPAKLPLPKAKLEAKAVNEKQWLNPAAPASAAAAPAAAPLPAADAPAKASSATADIAKAAAIAGRSYADALAAAMGGAPAHKAAEHAPADYSRAIETQKQIGSITTTFQDKLTALAKSSTTKLASGASAARLGPNELSKFRQEAIEALRKSALNK